MWLLSVFFIKIFFKITEIFFQIFFKFILLKKVMNNIELYIFILHEGMCPLPSCSVFSTAWVREVLYKSLNLLAAIRNN